MIEFKFENKDVYAISAIFLICLGMGQFFVQATLPEFSQAMLLRDAALGHPAPLHAQVAAYAAQAYSALSGTSASSSQAIVGTLLLLSPLILSLSSIFLFAAIRSLGFGRTVSVFSTLLFCLSFGALQFLPGYYGSVQLAALPFSIFLFLLCNASSGKKPFLFIPAAIFAAIAGYLSVAFGIACLVAVLAFGLQHREWLAYLSAIAVLAMAASCASPDFALVSFNAQSLQSLLTQSPFLLAVAACAAVLYFLKAAVLRYFALAFGAFIISGFNPVPAAMLLTLSAAEGASGASKESLGKAAKLACAFALGFFAVLGMALLLADMYRASAIALLVGILAPMLVHFYEYKNQRIFAAFFIFLFACSVFLAAFQLASPTSAQKYFDSDLAAALSSDRMQKAQSVYLLGFQDAARFYAPSVELGNQSELSDYIYSGKGSLPKGSLVALSLSQIYSGEFAPASSPAFSAYAFLLNSSSRGNQFAIFSSSDGALLARDLDSSGGFALRDGALLDSSGRQYASVPLSRMILLRQDRAYSSHQNLLLALEDGAPLPELAGIYSNRTSLQLVQDFGKVSVFEVN